MPGSYSYYVILYVEINSFRLITAHMHRLGLLCKNATVENAEMHHHSLMIICINESFNQR